MVHLLLFLYDLPVALILVAIWTKADPGLLSQLILRCGVLRCLWIAKFCCQRFWAALAGCSFGKPWRAALAAILTPWMELFVVPNMLLNLYNELDCADLQFGSDSILLPDLRKGLKREPFYIDT